MSTEMFAFVDESGQRSPSKRSSDYFVMAAVLVKAKHLDLAYDYLRYLKQITNRKPDDLLHWSKLKDHHRSEVATALGQFEHLHYTSVVACKRVLAEKAEFRFSERGETHELPLPLLSEDEAYLKTFQYLYERITWFARTQGLRVSVRMEHTQRFKLKTLREFENKMRRGSTSSIEWATVARPVQLLQKKDEPLLQLSDVVASGIAQAFNPGRGNITRTDYIQSMLPRIWCGYKPEAPKITTYGIKMHPWDETTKKMHPWLLALKK